MRVVILGRTKMGEGVCVGAMIEATGQPVRLLPAGRVCHPPHAPFEVGDVWDVELRARTHLEPPHVEDHDCTPIERLDHWPNVLPFLRLWVRRPWLEDPSSLFDGTLRQRSRGTAYLPRGTRLPAGSVGFWVLPHALLHIPLDNERRFVLQHRKPLFRIPYVGTAPLPRFIPAGTLVRVSLARWWLNPNHLEEGETCALQLSGWYPSDRPPPQRIGPG
jgi:hypothetical protein